MSKALKRNSARTALLNRNNLRIPGLSLGSVTFPFFLRLKMIRKVNADALVPAEQAMQKANSFS